MTEPHELTTTPARVALLKTWGDDLTAVEAARVSTNHDEALISHELADLTASTRAPLSSEELARAHKLLKYLWTHQHTSPFEHAGATFSIEAPIFTARQIMRHRTLSYNEISRRYTESGLKIWTPHPDHMRAQHSRRLQCSTDDTIDRAEELADLIGAHATASARLYHQLISAGLAREVARAVLPCSTITRFYMSGNLLNLIKMIKLRMDSHAQPEAQAVAAQMLELLRPSFPFTLALAIGPET